LNTDDEYSIYNSNYQIDLKEHIKFELKSLIGRYFYNKKPKLSNRNLLHLGCGNNRFDDWINADFFTYPLPWKKEHKKPDWCLDLRYPLNCESNI